MGSSLFVGLGSVSKTIFLGPFPTRYRFGTNNLRFKTDTHKPFHLYVPWYTVCTLVSMSRRNVLQIIVYEKLSVYQWAILS